MAAKKKASKKAPAKKKSASKRKPNAAFMKAMQPDASLSAVIGGNAMPRTEVTKKIWAYIKKNNLQDNKNRRMINSDEKLRDVFGGKKQVSMFEMTKLVNKHLK
jgi:chromatin remodeling complex protein RSC6